MTVLAGRKLDGRSMVFTTGTMAWLPCIRYGSDRWWLPRSAIASDLAMRVLLGAGDLASLRRAVGRTLLRDPSLFLFCVLKLSGQCPAASSVTTNQLADWFVSSAASQFAGGDALLGAPEVDAAKAIRANSLTKQFQSLSVQHWVQDAAVWLESFGPRVPGAWRRQWPAVAMAQDNAKPTSDLSDPQDPLQQLARTIQQTTAFQASFDARLGQAKLDAIKQLAYGLSHEINNPLANISTRAQLLKQDETDASRAETLQRIIDQVYRAHEMIADLMFYANPPTPTRQRCDLVSIVSSVAGEFQNEADRLAIGLERSLPAQPRWHDLDRDMIAEALRVLVRNAIEAVGCQGTIVISLCADDAGDSVHVADSGPGLSAEARQHAFDPYYSGREAGRGLGLGLCRAYRIMQLHDAKISLAGGAAGCVATLQLDVPSAT